MPKKKGAHSSKGKSGKKGGKKSGKKGGKRSAKGSAKVHPQKEVDVLGEVAMTNLYYIAHGGVDALEIRGFTWEGGGGKKKKGKKRGKKK